MPVPSGMVFLAGLSYQPQRLLLLGFRPLLLYMDRGGFEQRIAAFAGKIRFVALNPYRITGKMPFFLSIGPFTLKHDEVEYKLKFNCKPFEMEI
jgi:hypothetical protein